MKFTITANNLKEATTVSAPTAERAIEKLENYLGKCLDHPVATPAI